MPVAAALAGLGFALVATEGTAATLEAAGLEVERIRKMIEEGVGATVVDLVRRGRCDLVINTPQGYGARTDGYAIREAALVNRVPCITTVSGAAAAVHAIAQRPQRGHPQPPGKDRADAQQAACVARRRARSGRTRFSRWSGEGWSRGCRGSSSCSRRRDGCCRGRCRSASLPEGELAFLIDPIGPGTRALCAARAGDEIGVLGPLGSGFRRVAERRSSSAGASGWRRFRTSRNGSAVRLRCSASAAQWHAEAAALVPNAEVVIDPVLVTDAMPSGHDVLACGPEPMLEAVRTLAPDAQLAWEAPMACGFGACYGCVVEMDGLLKRLCVEGPVLDILDAALATRPSRASDETSQRERMSRRADGAGRRARTRCVRDENGDADAAGRKRTRAHRRDGRRHAQLDRTCKPGA